jgi:hypothetical protein
MSGLKLFARIVLLVAGLALIIPDVLAPVLTVGVGMFTVQWVVGVLAIVLALYFIIKKVP